MKRINLISMLFALTALTITACGNQPPAASEKEDNESGPVATDNPECGNGVWEQGEECEGKMGLEGVTCQSRLGVDGDVKCTNCKIDLSSCKGTPVLASKYKATFHYNLSGILPADSSYYKVMSFMASPSKFVSDLAVEKLHECIKDQNCVDLGGGNTQSVAAGAIWLFKDDIKDMLKGIIDAHVVKPETQALLKPAADAMTEIIDMISDLEVESTMKLVKNSNSLYKVEESWDTMGFNWDFNCVADCHKKLEAKKTGLVDGENLTAKYDMTFYEKQNKANFTGRNFTLEYGKLIVYIYQQVVIPAVAKDDKANNSTALIKSIFNPESLAAAICASDDVANPDHPDWNPDNDPANFTIGDYKIPKKSFATVLNKVAELGGNELDEYIGEVTTEIGNISLESQGQFVTADNNNDFTMDKLTRASAEENNVTGTVTINNPVTGQNTPLDMKAFAFAEEIK